MNKKINKNTIIIKINNSQNIGLKLLFHQMLLDKKLDKLINH
jgi:hypothetical protein